MLVFIASYTRAIAKPFTWTYQDIALKALGDDSVFHNPGGARAWSTFASRAQLARRG